MKHNHLLGPWGQVYCLQLNIECLKGSMPHALVARLLCSSFQVGVVYSGKAAGTSLVMSSSADLPEQERLEDLL